MLAAFDLAGDDDTAWDMREADGSLDFVYVLAALAAGAERIELDVVGLNVDFDTVVDFRNSEDGSERRVAARRLIERRDADEAMNTVFAGEHAVSIFAFDLHRGGLDASFFAGRFVEHVGAKAFSFSPAEIHAQKDRSPILRLGAARAGLNRKDGVELVALAREQRLGFERTDIVVGSGEFLRNIVEDRIALGAIGFFFGKAEIGFDVARFGVERLLGGNAILELLAFLQNGLRLRLIVPKVGGAYFCFKFLELLLRGGRVKDNSGRAPYVFGARRSAAEDLRCVRTWCVVRLTIAKSV